MTDDYKKDLLESFCPDEFLAVSLKPPTRGTAASLLLDESLNAADGGASLVTCHSEESRAQPGTISHDSNAQTEIKDRSSINTNEHGDPQKSHFKLGRLIEGRRARKKAQNNK